MPLFWVICMTHGIGFPFSSESCTELLYWCGTVFSALLQLTCRNTVALYRPQMAIERCSGGKFLVPSLNTLIMQCRAFSVVAPSIWHSLPLQIRLLPRVTRLCSKNCLKLIFSPWLD